MSCNGVKIENLIYGAEQESGIRPGTENVGHIAGLGKACQIAYRDFDKNRSHMYDMRKKLLEGFQVRPPFQAEICLQYQTVFLKSWQIAMHSKLFRCH